MEHATSVVAKMNIVIKHDKTQNLKLTTAYAVMDAEIQIRHDPK